jgi:iron(III) transport system substrate-binding protein
MIIPIKRGGMAMLMKLLGTTMLVASLLGSAAQAADQRVVVYTAHEASIVEQMVPRFEKETGIKVDIIKAGGGDLLNRLKAEAAAPRADVIWSVGSDLLAGNPQLFQAYKPAGFDASTDPKFIGTGNWLPYTGVIMVMMVNTDQVKPADYPKGWMDLVDPKWKGKISSARADSSSSAFIQYFTILSAFPDKGADIYSKIFSNFALSDSSGAVPRFVSDGEAAIGLTLEDNALQYVRGGGKVAILYPSEGTSLTADGVALVKGAPDAELGKKFIDYVLSQPIQQILVQSIGRRSIRTDVAANPVLPPLPQIKTIPYDLEVSSRDRLKLLAAWKKIAASQ